MNAIMKRLHLSVLPLALAAGLILPGADQAHADEAVPAGTAITVGFHDAVDRLPVYDEDRTGYKRTSFKHWTDDDRDGCSTRAEVLIEESLTAVEVGPRCALAGGEWMSEYDQATTNDPKGLDIDHRVPLAEGWDSGASAWSPEDRQAYANDLGDPRSLLAVTAKENRSKADKDVAQWLPTDVTMQCRYLVDWVAVKLRWGLAVDQAEREKLYLAGQQCADEDITVSTAKDIPAGYSLTA